MDNFGATCTNQDGETCCARHARVVHDYEIRLFGMCHQCYHDMQDLFARITQWMRQEIKT